MTTTIKPLALDGEFDPVKVGNKLAQETAVLEIHISQPGFKKSIDSAHFMKTLEGMSEDDIAALSPEMKKMVENFQKHKNLSNGQEKKTDDGKPDPDMIHVSQDLLDKKAIAAIAKHDKRFTNWIKYHAIASPIKFQGAYLMRLNMVDEIDATVLEYISERKNLVDTFGARWNKLIEDAQKRRGPFFDASDYPLFSQVKTGYNVEARWLSFNVPAALERINEQIYKRESEKAQIFFADVAQEARDAARIAFQGLTEHLLTQLGTDDAGNPKRFHGASVKKLKEFVEMFLGGGDLTGDNELKTLAGKAKDILSGVDPTEVRKEEGLKSTLKNAVQVIQNEAAKLIVVSRRKFGLDDDDDEVPGPLNLDE